jgi:hypothetical protein
MQAWSHRVIEEANLFNPAFCGALITQMSYDYAKKKDRGMPYWRQRLGTPPQHISADLTRRRLAYELQVREYGGLKPETRRRLRQYYKAFKANPHHTPSSNLGLKPGIVLVREWNGAEHRVTVLGQGFEHRGERYRSLSQVARRITGSRWSGPAFFGLKRRGLKA